MLCRPSARIYATQITDAEKYQRESYKASDIDRYTTIKTEGPRYCAGLVL